MDLVALADVIHQLLKLADQLAIYIDQQRLSDQTYLNDLHRIYVKSVAVPPWRAEWLEFHDCIHLLEIKNGHRNRSQSIWFDYQHLAGPLEKQFDRSWLQHAVTEISAGECFLREHELGKDLVTCWRDQEPNTLDNLGQLAKPWLKLRPLLNIALHDTNSFGDFQSRDMQNFQQWFGPVQKQWCEHWNLKDWNVAEIFSVIPIGRINDLGLVQQRFMSYNYPMKVRPCPQLD